MTAPAAAWPPWSGSWVAARLGVRLSDGDRTAGAGLADLLGLAVRRNPRRAHLLVSNVLGKHVPTDPRLVYGAGLLLGALVRGLIGPGQAAVDPCAGLLAEALKERPGAATALRDRLAAAGTGTRTVVLGYAETATGLGHSVADALGADLYLHSTRRPVDGVHPYGGFEEEHSHATSHLLLPAEPAALASSLPLVLVDDELSTGTTALNTIRTLHRLAPRELYVLAALVDLRTSRDRDRMREAARSLGVRIEGMALATGRVVLPPGVEEAARELVHASAADEPPARPGSARHVVRRVALRWPRGLPDGGRHGFTPAHRARLDGILPALAADLARALPPLPPPGQGPFRVLVLGFEELMYVPLRLAESLADLLGDRAAVRYSTTTRSPVLAVDDPGYAIRTRLEFPDHDAPADGPGRRYAYNVAPGADPARGFDAIVLVVDAVGDSAALEAGLLAALAELAPVVLATVPAYRPGAPERRRAGQEGGR